MRKFVFFDLGNVLIHFDHQIAVEQLAQLANRLPSEVHNTVFASQLQNEYETGLVTSEQYAAKINQQLGTHLPTADVLDATSAIFAPNSQILPLLEELKDRQVPLAILSNTCVAHWEWIASQNWELPGEWFDFHVLSYQVHSMKPDARIYATCEKLVQRSAADIFFTDDREENCLAAEDRGWTTHLYRSVEGLRNALMEWLEPKASSR